MATDAETQAEKVSTSMAAPSHCNIEKITRIKGKQLKYASTYNSIYNLTLTGPHEIMRF